MNITFDPGKRQKTLDERGLDFADAIHAFQNTLFEVDDTRKDYGERRVLCYGYINKRLVVVGYVPRGTDRHVFTMRKVSPKEARKITTWQKLNRNAAP